MEVSDFLNQPELEEVIQEAQFLRYSGKRFSDIIDKDGFQYTDLVLDGSGILDFSLLGYTFVLEEAGIRFFDIAGQGSGALKALLLTVAGTLNQHKSIKALKILNRIDLGELEDGNRKVNQFLQQQVNGQKTNKLNAWLNLNRLIRRLNKSGGLNPGDRYREWLQDLMADHGIQTIQSLNYLRQQIPAGLKHRSGISVDNLVPRLAIIASDITTHTQVEFPKMSSLFWEHPDQVSPAEFVMAATALPLYFEPVKMDNIPDQGVARHEDWIEHAGYYGKVPEHAVFCQNLFSKHFPIEIFHDHIAREINKPTFGIKSTIIRDGKYCGAKLKDLLQGLIAVNRNRDLKNLHENSDFNQITTLVELPSCLNAIGLNVPDNQKLGQFKEGAQAAIEFLNNFNWSDYKNLRRSMKNVSSRSNSYVVPS